MSQSLKVVSAILLIVFSFGFSVSLAQDDLYVDDNSPKAIAKKLKKDSIACIPWNDSVSDNFSMIYFYNSTRNPISIQVNNSLIGTLTCRVQFNYKIYSEGKISIITIANGEPRQLFLEVKNGKKYFVETNFFTRSVVKEVASEYAFAIFRPISIIRLDENHGNSPMGQTKGSGSGFLISTKGYIVTNHHVIDKTNTIYVKGVNGNLAVKYKAKVILSDKNNDLALLKIVDSVLIDSIPYGFKIATVQTGENVFVLGYPYKSLLGEEIKVTNGIVSAKSGYMSDINSYQISAPVQPGNSGGPAFDVDGNVIGIVNAKVDGAENVSYAIKVRALLNLLMDLEDPIELKSKTGLQGKKLSDQILQIQNFVLIIETE